ncbi:MAG: HAD-IIA family hydrolase [Anaerolineae bacterium]
MAESRVAAVLLAAGGSTRFGEPKQLLSWEGRPLVVHTADVAWAAGLDPVVAVVGAASGRVAPLLADRPVQVLRNYRWRDGMSTSLHIGLAALPGDVDAALFLPIDQPCIVPRFLQALVDRWRSADADIVVPTWEGRRGGPVLFGRSLFGELARLDGDVGGRALFDAHRERLVTLSVEDPRWLIDVDTPEDYARLQDQVDRSAPAEVLGAVRALIVDMDGVLWRGDSPLPGLHAFFDLVRARHLRYTLITNNSSRTPEDYVAKLARFGVETKVEHVLNSSLATADYLAARAASGATVFPVGGPGVRAALRSRGFRLVEDGSPVDYVVVGWDVDMNWETMARAALLIRGGAEFIGTNPDRSYPSERGLVPGAGAQLALLETATDVRPVIVGKPEPVLYRQALQRMDATPAETLVIGDRLDTDILGGVRLRMRTALLLSGVQQEADLATSPVHPDLVFEDLRALVTAWSQC